MKPHFTQKLSPTAAKRILSVLSNAKLIIEQQEFLEDAAQKVRFYLNKEINQTLGQTRSTLIKFLSMEDDDLISGISSFIDSFVDDIEEERKVA